MIRTPSHLFRQMFGALAISSWLVTGLAAVAQEGPLNVLQIVASADTSLFENNPENNLGGMSYVPIGVTFNREKARGLFKFDLMAGGLPQNALVSNVTFNLTIVYGIVGTYDYTVHRVLQDWTEGTGDSGEPDGLGVLGRPAVEGEATWEDRKTGTAPWNIPGGEPGVDYVSVPSASARLEVEAAAITSAALTADVRRWLANPQSNFGWLVMQPLEALQIGSARRFASRQSTNALDRPRLVIQYRDPPITLLDPRMVNNVFQFDFLARTNKAYSVEYRDTLNAGVAWVSFTNIPVQAIPSTLTISQPRAPTNRFFRVLEH